MPPDLPAPATPAQLLSAASGPCAHLQVFSKSLLPHMLPEVRWGPLDSHDLALFPQVVGLVTRKDLARYRLGKGGLEELSLAQT